MELSLEQKDAGDVTLSNVSESTNPENSHVNQGNGEETKNEQAMISQDQESLNASIAPHSEIAMPQANAGIGGSKMDEVGTNIPAVTPPSVDDGVQPAVATLEDAVATDVESPAPTPETSTQTTDASVELTNDDAQGDAETTKVASGDQPQSTTTSESKGDDAPTAERKVVSGEQAVAFTNDDAQNPGTVLVSTNAESVNKGAQQEEAEMASDAKPSVASVESMDVQPRELESSESDAARLPEGGETAGDQQMTAVIEPKGESSPLNPEAHQTSTSSAESMDDKAQNVQHEGSPDGQPTITNNSAQKQEAETTSGDLPMPMDIVIESQSNDAQVVATGVEPMDDSPQLEGAANDQAEVAGEADSKPSSVAPPAAAAAAGEVIDLLDSDEEEPPVAKRQRTEGVPISAGAASYQSAVARMPGPAVQQNQGVPLQQQQVLEAFRNPRYDEPVPGFVPTWKNLVPASQAPRVQPQNQQKWKYFELSLLNVSEFTITGLRVGDEYSGYMTSVAGLRTHIKKISKGHGNAFFERDPEGGTGKWHIPLGAYHAFYGFLKSDPLCRVDGISEAQLKIASLGKARLEKDYPSARKLVKLGVPKQLADALAPFQRGGVDFVIEKEGRALIADEMGLGKTIQGIASMAVYHEEWPLLVFCPSSARYHWENEFRHWLGKNSAINDSEHAGAFDAELEENKSEDEADDVKEPRAAMPLLHDSQIHVLSSGQSPIFPHETTKVVICSYGLAPNLVTNGKLVPGMFKCAIVDESHMLKNKATQRTSKLLPVLRETSRCVLLSGTPAFARPLELWPQLLILKTERHGWWQEEKDYINKYSRGGTQRRAELHTMLMGTVMIRRMKNDILKTLPVKLREQGIVDVMDESTRREMQECMVILKTGKGKLGQLARDHSTTEEPTESQAAASDSNGDQHGATSDSNGDHHGATNGATATAQDRSEVAAAQLAAASDRLRQDIDHRRAQGQAEIRHTIAAAQHQMDPEMIHSFVQQMQNRLEDQLRVYYQQQIQRISTEIAAGVGTGMPLSNATSQPEPPSEKKAVLNHMYSLTGRCKIPIVVEMLKRWLADPTRGKLCIFAHHISVLDEIASGAGLSNAVDSATKYIRIDGSTTPRARQDQINSFQTDSSIRVAVLGITAAGVAVTLTAASTVLFAELFWTPAIMIQAEDRVHRIGQQAQVKCLYVVAKGTLDEILWKLLENKFEALGEFVEGKEKMKMVVNKIYHSTHELLKTVGAEDSEAEDFDSECSLSDVQELGSDLEHEIEELALNEQKELLAAAGATDDSDPETQTESDAKPAAKISKKDTIGTTEDAAICLSDDDDDVEVVPVASAGPQNEESTAGDSAATSQQAVAKKPAFNLHTASFPQLRVYRLLFGGPKYGLIFSLVGGRMVVSGRHEDRDRVFGPEAKPHVGDVLVAINTQIVPIVQDMSIVTRALHAAKTSGTTVLAFAEDSEIAHYAKERLAKLEKEKQEREAQLRQAVVGSAMNAAAQNGTHQAPNAQHAAAPLGPDEVIEID